MPFSETKKIYLEMFASLPSELVLDILSRLPALTVVNCKCVCKSWLQLIDTKEFVMSHLSKSTLEIALFQGFQGCPTKLCKVIEFRDVLDIEHCSRDLNSNAIIKPHFPNDFLIKGSVDGLLLLHKSGQMAGQNGLYVCNPITRDYIDIDSQEFLLNCGSGLRYGYGFGKSKITSKYKVVMLTQKRAGSLPECRVYTIGTGSCRRIALDYVNQCNDAGAFVNGNIHWLASNFKGSWICCFDLKTEFFSRFSLPLPASRSKAYSNLLCVLEDCLCYCTTITDETEIWLMDEYGVEESWTKKFVIPKTGGYGCRDIPVKVFKNGDVLLLGEGPFLNFWYYSRMNKTVRKIVMLRPYSHYPIAALHISSFLSLKGFAMENTISY